MKTRHVIFVMVAVFFLSSSLLAHTFYKWVDERGAVNYTDDYNNIPPAYRDRAEIEWVHEEGPLPPIQKITPQRGEENKKGYLWSRRRPTGEGRSVPGKNF